MSQEKSQKTWSTRAGLYTLGALAAMAVAYYAYLRYRPQDTPASQPPLLHLTTENFQQLRQRFNAEQEKTRLIVMLSPT